MARARELSWAGFAADAPELAAAVRRALHVGMGEVAIGFLATAAGAPHVAPVCPIFGGDDVFVIAAGASPKTRDLRANGAYALHAFLGANDEELQIAGHAHELQGAAERAAVHAAVRFAAFKRDDPIFRFTIARALWVYWERVGQPDTAPVRRRWTAR